MDERVSSGIKVVKSKIILFIEPPASERIEILQIYAIVMPRGIEEDASL